MFVLGTIPIVGNLSGNFSGLVEDLTNTTGTGLPSLQGNTAALVGGAVLVVAAFIIWKIMKDLLANVIIGAIGLIIVTQVFRMDIPLNVATIIVSLVFGIGGVGALLLLTYLGALKN